MNEQGNNIQLDILLNLNLKIQQGTKIQLDIVKVPMNLQDKKYLLDMVLVPMNQQGNKIQVDKRNKFVL